jgi:hypothetical protein
MILPIRVKIASRKKSRSGNTAIKATIARFLPVSPAKEAISSPIPKWERVFTIHLPIK